jgi:hypothetical protein
MRRTVIDDEPTARLESFGVVDGAGNARDGLDVIRAAMESSQPCDLVGLDLSMPGTTGTIGRMGGTL